MPDQSTQGVSNEADNRSCFWRYITAITRTWALLTIVGLWALTVQAFREKEKDNYTHWYLLAISPVVTLLEILWILNKCACCAYDEGCCCKFWHGLLWIDGWFKSILYTVFAIPCFLKGIVAMWAVIYGVLLFVLAVFYFFKSIETCCTRKPSKKDTERPADDPKSSLVQREVQPGLSSTSYSATGTTPPQGRSQPDWPPPGYDVGPDGTLYAVKNEPDEVKPQKREENYKVKPSSDWPPAGYEVDQDGALREVKKVEDQDGFEPEAAAWPPPGFEVGRDGTLQEVRGNKATNSGRKNPFNKVNS